MTGFISRHEVKHFGQYGIAILEFAREFLGENWREEITPLPAGKIYVDRLNEIANTDPALLIAHAYTRYMGDLSGGQALKNIVRSALNLPADIGTGLHDFEQMHWGGETPNYLSLSQIEKLWAAINQHFRFAPKAEISIEVNPRYLERKYVLFLKYLGFNRISFGIQDFNPQVQEAVNRIQPEDLLFNVMDWIR